MKAHSLILVSIAMLGATEVRAADGCKLEKYAEMPVTMSGTRPLISGKVNGIDGRFMVDTGAPFNMFNGASIEKFNLKLGPLLFGFRVGGVGGAEPDAHLAVVR